MRYYNIVAQLEARVKVVAHSAEEAVKRARTYVESGNAALTEMRILEVVEHDGPVNALAGLVISAFLLFGVLTGVAAAQSSTPVIISDPNHAEIVFTDDDPTVVNFLCRVAPVSQTTTIAAFQCGKPNGTAAGVTTYTQPLPAGLTNDNYVVTVEACSTICSGPSDPFFFAVNTGVTPPPPPPPPTGPHKPIIVTVRPIAQ